MKDSWRCGCGEDMCVTVEFGDRWDGVGGRMERRTGDTGKGWRKDWVLCFTQCSVKGGSYK